MKDFDKTKEQLITELEQLRQQLAQLKSPEASCGQMGKALKESEKRYQDIVEDQTELICRFLPDGTLTFVNKTCCRYFSKRREELMGCSFMLLIPSKDCEGIKEHIVSLSRRKFVTTHEHCILASDGEARWLEWTIRAIFGKGSRAIEFQAVGRGITERKQAEEDMRRSEEKFRSLISNIPDLVWTSDDKLRIVFFGPNVESLTGYTQDYFPLGVTWTNWYKRVHPDDVKEAKEAFLELMRNGKLYNIEYRFQRKDGKWIWVTDRSVGTYKKDGKLYADGLVSDITKRKQAEVRLSIFQQRLRSLASQISVAEEKERRRLAAGLHDQVTQTLAVIKLKLGALQKEASFNNQSKQLDEIRELVHETIQKTRSLTFELSPPVLYELGLEAAIEWLTEHFQEHYGIECEFRDDGQLKLLEEEHRGILFAAVRELLFNVVKHSQARTARVSIQRERNRIRVSVQDDGVGFNLLEMGQQPKAFGLFNIRERLNYLGGHVEIESEHSGGTLVTLIAPLQSRG